MRFIFMLLLTFLTLRVFAQVTKSPEEIEREKRFQEAAAKAGTDTAAAYGWKHSVVSGLNVTQISFTDWVQGGENALAYTLWLRGSSIQEMEKTTWTNAYKLAFGQTRLGTQGLRKADDDIYLEGLLVYKMGIYINPYFSATFRSQFAKGFQYDDQGNRTPVSKFFDPAYITQSIGVAYKPAAEVTTRLGAGVREVLTSRYNVYAGGEKTKVDGGLESVTDVDWKFAKNMVLTSKLEIFAPFKTLDRMIVRSDNVISAKVNEYIVTTLSVQLINDVTASPRTQVKEVLALGLSYTLL